MGSSTLTASPAYASVFSSRIQCWITYATIVFADVFALTMAGSIAVVARYMFHAQYVLSDWLGVAPALLIFFVVFAFSGLYPGIATSPTDEFRVILRASSVSVLLLVVITFFLREGIYLSRIVIALAWVLTVILVPVCRRAVRGFCIDKPWWGVSTVILGERKAGLMMLDLLRGHPRLGLRPVAFLSEDHKADDDFTGLEGIFVGDIAHAHRFAETHSDCYAVLAMPTSGSEQLKRVVTNHTHGYRNVLVIPDLFGIPSLSVSAKDVCGVLTLKLDQPLTMRLPKFCKRTFDLSLSLLGALLISPVLLVLAIAVKLSSPGPIFYGQRRIGRNQREFRVWKFRSMLVNADEVLRTHLDADPALLAEWTRDHKLKKDPRVTRIGRLLRKSSLDELPQIWNVICGDMSLVGPRPIVEAEIEKYGDSFYQYQLVNPGVTGLWQVSGRNNTTYELRTKIDDYYVRNWSLSLDAYILLRTIKTILLSEGAY